MQVWFFGTISSRFLLLPKKLWRSYESFCFDDILFSIHFVQFVFPISCRSIFPQLRLEWSSTKLHKLMSSIVSPSSSSTASPALAQLWSSTATPCFLSTATFWTWLWSLPTFCVCNNDRPISFKTCDRSSSNDSDGSVRNLSSPQRATFGSLFAWQLHSPRRTWWLSSRLGLGAKTCCCGPCRARPAPPGTCKWNIRT